MSAAEIHRTLIDAGRITRPMPINKFGGLLKRKGFTKYSLARGKKGYLVIEHKYQDINDKHKEEAQEVLSTMPTPPQENEALEDANLAINDADSKLPDNCLPF